ncbi:MAG TPA: sigma-54 dependent transcriptional regulator [Polyangiaceae bacterium]|nr:sigma-54 dependent transcriptional regulator [Polyangiaceae bacterium]
MEKSRYVLVLCENARLVKSLCTALEGRGFEPVVASSAGEARRLVLAWSPAAALLDLPVKGANSRELVRDLKQERPDMAVVLGGTDDDVRVATDAFEVGGYEYLEPVTVEGFLSAVGRSIGTRRGDVHLRYLREKDAPPNGWAGLIGRSRAMEEVVGVLQQVCRRTSRRGAATILLNGETGTGKGFAAKCIHYNSARRNEAFVEVNCAAIPPSLMESEFFGHERGAFTDAKVARTGLFEAASGGTLFLDEIGAVPPDLQAKLLTAIDEKRVRRLGSRRSEPFDVQIIAATHEDLEARAREGLFRHDLFHRLNVVAVTMPPLRERADDVVLLAESFVKTLCADYGMPPRTLSDGARSWILRYSWPGNVRELRNRIERVILLEDGAELRAEHFGPPHRAASGIRILPSAAGLRVELPPEGVPLGQLERAVIREALEQCGGNVSRAARFLSVSRQTLIYRMKKHALGHVQHASKLVPLEGRMAGATRR